MNALDTSPTEAQSDFQRLQRWRRTWFPLWCVTICGLAGVELLVLAPFAARIGWATPLFVVASPVMMALAFTTPRRQVVYPQEITSASSFLARMRATSVEGAPSLPAKQQPDQMADADRARLVAPSGLRLPGLLRLPGVELPDASRTTFVCNFYLFYGLFWLVLGLLSQFEAPQGVFRNMAPLPGIALLLFGAYFSTIRLLSRSRLHPQLDATGITWRKSKGGHAHLSWHEISVLAVVMPFGKGMYDPQYYLVFGADETRETLAWRTSFLSSRDTSRRVCGIISEMIGLPLSDLTAQAQQAAIGIPHTPASSVRT